MYYNFDPDSLEDYEIGAALATIIALPPSLGDEEKRSRYHTILCAEALRERYKRDEEWANTPQRLKPIYAFYDLGAVAMDMNTINRQLQHRLQAAHVAIAFLKEAETGQIPPDLPPDAKRLSVNELVRTLKLVDEEAGEEINVDNFETRVWRPSLPVIHLAAAFAVNMQQAAKEGKQTSAGDLIFDQAIIADIIGKAELYEELLPKSKIQINMDNLVRVRLGSGLGSPIS